MGSFYDDFKKKQNKSQNKPTLIKVPQVAPKSNDRRATAARNREQQRVQAHGGQTQTTQRVNTQQRTTVRQNTSAGSSQRSTPIVQRTQSTQQNSFGLRSPQQLLNSAQSSSIANVNRFSAKQAAQQRRNPRQNVSTATKSSGDGNPTLTQLLKNSMDWHTTSDPNRKAQLHAQNDSLRRKLGYEYNPQTGASYDKYGHEMTAGVRMAYGSKPTERLNQATQLLHTSGVMGKTDKATVYPTAMQAAQGLDEDYFSGQTGYNAHKTMHDLFNRSDETWSSEDTQSRDRARQELTDEMGRIMKRYGLTYQPRDNADDIMNRLKAAGADEQTLAYVQENIDLRHAADRLGNGMEAIGKRWIASLPSLVDTSRQVSANVEESRQNEEYRQLEEQEQTLELTLQGMNSTAADGSVPADYQAVYDQLQEVKKRKNELTVNKGVDPNKWSQRMLREANEAQANAEAGLAPAPRWLTEQGISLAGNAPVMAASAIPVVGPAVGSIMMGGQAAGQRSFELNERGIGARESLTRGLTSGAIEAATERLPLGQMSKILHSGGVNAVKNILIQMGEEATEESASYFMNYVADKAAQDPDAKFSLAELTQSAAGGAFGGLVFGTAGAVGSRGVYGSPTENQLTNRPMTEYEVQADTPYLQVERFTEPLTQTMVKIDEQMRKAETLPEGTIKQQYTAALQEDAQRVSKQLSILENNRAELMQARNIAERFGAKFELADLGPAGGKYENGTITVNPYSSSPVRQVLVHELTHHLENSGSYNALQEMALHLFTQEQGVSADVLRDNITRMYAEQGVTLDTQAANRELTAAFCEKRLFQDDASIQRLAQTDVSLFQRIRQWIADTVIRLRGTKEQQQLLELQRRYEKAARTVGAVQDRGAQYKIETLPDGKQYVKSDRQVIEGDDASAWSKQAEQFINEKIRNNADLRVFTKDGFAIDITERSAYKLSDPHVQSIEKVARPMLGREALKAKMQAAGHIDELAETARWSKFAPDRNGKHAYDIGEDGFDTFTTYFEDSDGQYYRVRFTAGVNEDMDTAYSIGQMDKRNHPSSAGSSSAPFGRGAQNTRMVYDNSITPDGANDNTSGTKFKGLALQREYRQAVESGNMERAREILAEKAARRGYLSYDTTADAQNHIIQNANPVEDDYHTWIRNAGDVHSFAEVLNDSDWNGMDFDPDYTWDMAQKALQTGEITVYSSYPIGTLGGFVTPSRMEAEGYAGNGEVYSKTVNLDDIAWIDPTQGQYAPTQNGSIYKQGSPYAKIPDVTYDDNGKLIPLSQRYDDSRTDSRYTLGFTPEQIAKGTVPLSDAMQYGKTPEQAVMEARAKAEGERVRQAREEQAAAEQQERLDRITNGKNRDIMQRVYEAQERAERVASRHALERATTRATASDADSYIDHTQENIAIDLVNSLESERRFLTNLRNGWHLSDAELVNAERMAAGRGPVTEMDSHRYELVETYARAMRQYNEDMQPYYAFQRGLDDARLRRATELIKDSDNWKDSRGNLGLQIRTPERVLRKVMGDTAETEAIYQAYFAPVLKHDAEAIRWENTQRERLKGIMEGLSHEDSVYMHMKNRAELSPKNEAMQKQLADYVKENKSKIHFKQAESAMQKLYEMTSEMHPQVSEAGVRNGYAPLEFRQKYIPSLTPTKEGKWYNRILRKVGVETMVDELPTEIAGRTEDRRPGRQYAGFYNQREGINTEFDAFKAMDNYISGASNAIFHTDDIQNLRVLEDAIRGKYSDEGSRAELEAIRKDPDINIEDKEQKISKIWERNSGTLPSFPSWIAEYTNILAGKKSRTDRSAEQMFGRGLYRAMSDVEGKVAANMVGGNLSTAISNFIPLAQGSGEVRYSSMMRAMLDYGADLAKKNPAFHEDSDFLTNRRGSERVIKTKLQKASDAAGWTMNAIDNLSSEVMVRARYLDNVEKRHMSTEAALQEADRWAAGLIGDRARGAKPVIMESKSPLIKAFTMFQLEVMNQYDHLFGDIPHNLRTQGRSKAQIAAGTAAALLQVFVMSHLFNDAREKLTGSRGAFDPIEMVNDFVGRLTGYALPNIFDLLGEMMGDGIDEDDFRAEKSETAWDNVTATAQDIASNIPFVSGPLGSLVGAGNSRLPIQSVIPSIANIATAQGEDARSMAMIKELSKPLYGFLLPFGGLQAKKTVEGAATMFAGGSYSYDKKGEKILQFPTYGQKLADWAQALLFKSSSDEARAWRESGYETLNAEETKVFDTLAKRADNDQEARKNIYDAIVALHDVQSDTDENGQLLDNEGEKKRRMLFENDKLTQSQKTAIDRDIIVNTVGGSTADYSDRTSFEISTEVRKKMQGAAHKAADAGLAVSTFAKYDNTLKELTEGTDENGEKLHTADEARGMVLDAIRQDSSLTDGEKQTLADYLLVSSMSEKARETWNDEVKGKVNASDFVRFKSDVAAYEAEFKGTGADHAANVANILNSYTNLTEEQKSILMNTYNDTAKNDVFHVSEYEKSLTDNSYYKSLNDSEKSKLRAYCNEYEQAISAGKELSGWKAKAYMAKEAGIQPGTYALFQTALSLINSDGGNAKNEEITQAVKLVPGLTDSQKAYLWQAAYGKESTKSNPWGGATVTKYQKGENKVVNPVEGGTIPDGGGFGWRTAPTTGASNNHKAIDIAAPQGTPVKAAMSGKIVGMNKYGYGKDEYEGYGVSVTVDCGNGITMAYHHMVDGSNANLNIGDEVKAGQQIGQVGSTGISTGPHLDFQVVKDGKYVDPRNYIPGYGEGTSETISAAQAAVAASSGKKSGKSHKSGGSGKSGGGMKTLDTMDTLRSLW